MTRKVIEIKYEAFGMSSEEEEEEEEKEEGGGGSQQRTVHYRFLFFS
jgi:hypothetical protein